jgi:hypothetical protein
VLVHDTRRACELSGTPDSHARCFHQVADATDCVISSRSVGRYATGLLLEGYASKGFHVKAKSCNWGPMAGFVLSDPRFTKRGTAAEAREAQRGDVHKALKDGAEETQVFISEERRKAVEEAGWMTRAGGTINEMVYTGKPPGGDELRFVLRRTMDGVPGARGKQMWGVFYATGEKALPGRLAKPAAPAGPSFGKPVARPGLEAPKAAGGLEPVMALVDPLCPSSLKGTYRAALTGDYDLWAVFPRAGAFAGRTADRRAVPGSDRFNVGLAEFAKHGDAHMGNVTPRVIDVKERLNHAIRAAGYEGGNAVHHGDEVGRPKVTEVELDFIAFVPHDRGAYFIHTLSDLKDFFRVVIRDYHITLNPGWQKQLGFATTPAGNWEA